MKLQNNTAQFSQFYSKLSQSMGVMGVVGNNPSSLISVQIPGVQVDVGLNPKDPQTQYFVSNFLNVSLECSYIATSKTGTVSEVYKNILDGKELAITSLTEDEKIELAAAEKVIGSEKYVVYTEFRLKYLAILDNYDTQTATSENNKLPPPSKKPLDDLLEEWKRSGFKEIVELSLATIQQLQGKERYVYWQELDNRFARHTRTLENGSKFQFIDSMPEYKDWFNDSLWTQFKFDAADYQQQRRSGGLGMTQAFCCNNYKYDEVHEPSYFNYINKFGLGLKCRSPIPTFPYNKRHSSQNWIAAWDEKAPDIENSYIEDTLSNVHDASLDNDLYFEFEFKRINIHRPWIDPNIFYSRMWRWSQQSFSYGSIVSSGGSLADNKRSTGMMPLLPNIAILTKDFRATVNSTMLKNWVDKQLSQNKTIRVGPFVIDSNAITYSNGKLVLASAPQIIGYVSSLIPECPNPDLTLKWPQK